MKKHTVFFSLAVAASAGLIANPSAEELLLSDPSGESIASESFLLPEDSTFSGDASDASGGESLLLPADPAGVTEPDGSPDAELLSAGEGEDEISSVGDAALIEMYRLFNPNNGEHFYTANESERRDLVNRGWIYEGTGWKNPPASADVIYRLYNPAPGFEEHHYTADRNEISVLTSQGWNLEGPAWCSDPKKTVPVYRLFNPAAGNSASSHHYTTDENERNVLVSRGWRAEGIGWYASEKGAPAPKPSVSTIAWNGSWPYASYSRIHSDPVTLYRAVNSNGITVAVNAGHGTAGGENYRTLCHPDGSAKVTGGSTGAGAVYAVAVSSGTTMLDGTEEGVVNLKLTLVLKEKLLNAGYNVLMIRENNNTQLDNIARTVFANQNADCHLALHYDSSTYDKGFFYIGVPSISSYRRMEPVASHYQQHNQLGECILSGMRSVGHKIYSSGNIELDLTQTSYSTVPSIDLEIGDRASSYGTAALDRAANGILNGLNRYFGK